MSKGISVPTFDLKTHHFDPKGRLLQKTPYTLYVEGGVKYFEQPVGSGNLFNEGGDPAGRITAGIINTQEAHVDYAPEQELTAAELSAQNAALQKELAAIKAERASKEVKAEAKGPTKEKS